MAVSVASVNHLLLLHRMLQLIVLHALASLRRPLSNYEVVAICVPSPSATLNRLGTVRRQHTSLITRRILDELWLSLSILLCVALIINKSFLFLA